MDAADGDAGPFIVEGPDVNGLASRRVLVAGIYLSDRDNHAAAISRELHSSAHWQVDLCWGAVGHGPLPDVLRAATRFVSPEPVSKFELINRLLTQATLDDYEHLVVVDDDIELPAGFLDDYLDVLTRRCLHLAQPARTHRSFIDHHFVAQLVGVEARRTRFVEIGPLFSIHRDAFPVLLPFDEAAPMGWGLDFVWPLQIENAGLRLGIVDKTPVTHRLRKPVAYYDYADTGGRMQQFLQNQPHLTAEQCFLSLQTWPASVADR